jgi:tetratricopeptide (TPR) repeat protein
MSKKIRAVLLIILLAVLINSCAPKKPEITPQQLAEYDKIIKEADTLYERGAYTCLKQAFTLYEEALAFPVFQDQNREKLLRTAILLAVREKELGFLEDTYLKKASNLITITPALADYSTILKIASTLPRKTAGIVGDFVEDGQRVVIPFDEIKENFADWLSVLKQKSKEDALYAYFSISFHEAFSYLIKENSDFASIQEAHTDSPLIRYKLSLYPKESAENLEKLLQDDPGFYEAYYFLGQIAFKMGQLITAEKNLLKAYQDFPESSSIMISLASLYFAFEELDKSLEYYEKSIKMAPNYRDALLGKAICLSYLGRHQEAIETCNIILTLGKYYLGETHYWLAWNQNELGELENAWENIENSKKYLIGYGQVYSLAGTIAFNQKNLDEAENNFIEACKQDASNGDPPYYMGKIKAIREDWLNSGVYFERASSHYQIKEELIQKRIKDIENSAFSEERKRKHVARKKNQLSKLQLTKATAWYNAAAGYYNAGMKEKALELVQKAASHSALKDKAQELLDLIEK